jgi:choline dehydrogenase-like flavoprotein
MTDDVVDVLIIGAGASGAAVAWSLADTRMRIVCFEQGDWTRPQDYPTNATNYESQGYGPWHIDPNV